MSNLERNLEIWCKSAIPVYRFMDIRIENASNGFYSCFVPLNASNSNHLKAMHASVLWACAEILGCLIVFATRPSDRFSPLVKHFDMQFIKPAVTDVISEAYFSVEAVSDMINALAEKQTHEFTLKIQLKNTRGEKVAESTGIYSASCH